MPDTRGAMPPVALTLDTYWDVPRLSGLVLSPDGSTLVTAAATVRTPGGDPVPALYSVPTSGPGEPTRLTWSAEGEAAPAFRPDGSLVFLSGRPAGDGRGGTGVWLLPAGGGEARRVLRVPGGVLNLAVASGSGQVVLVALLHPGARDLAHDEELESERGGALVFDHYPVRWWSSWLGPRQPRLLRLDPESGEVTDVSGDAGPALWDVYGHGVSVNADGTTVVGNWRSESAPGIPRFDLVAYGPDGRRVLAADGPDYFMPTVSPDGEWVACVARDIGSPERTERWEVVAFRLAGDERRVLTAGLDRWGLFPVWRPDSSGVVLMADDHARIGLFTASMDGEIVALEPGGSYQSPVCAPDGRHAYALRATQSEPQRIVSLSLVTPEYHSLSSPCPEVSVPGSLVELDVVARDGTPVTALLLVPSSATAGRPAPLVTWAHGGPIGSHNGWTWRYNPWLLVAEGYAALLPEPAQSSGYGQAFLTRGRGQWGELSFSDVLDCVDAAVADPRVDGSRLALAGSSFGGYLANWAAGHTDRFRAIVSISGIWSTGQHHGTSDSGVWQEFEFGSWYDPAGHALVEASSPHHHIGSIRTPMLVVHGERDFRVPVDQALHLWTDLQRHGVPSRLVVFPGEGHSIMGRASATVLYREIFAFLGQHLG